MLYTYCYFLVIDEESLDYFHSGIVNKKMYTSPLFKMNEIGAENENSCLFATINSGSAIMSETLFHDFIIKFIM
jgi:hypothetical protein